MTTHRLVVVFLAGWWSMVGAYAATGDVLRGVAVGAACAVTVVGVYVFAAAIDAARSDGDRASR